MSQVLTTASREWATRPDDQRFLTLEELRTSVANRRQESWTAVGELKNLRVTATEDDPLMMEVYDPTAGTRRQVAPSNWAFGQLAQHAGAPAAYLRKLPDVLAAINLQWGLEHNALRDEALMLMRANGRQELRSMTSTSYGRIWDEQVVAAVQRVNGDGRWVVPAASYATINPKRATTLYASDRDVFIFLVDPNHPIEVPGEKEPKFRGFYTWNSEVGAATFGICTFFYDRVCDNRTIWGATNVRELKMRHTGGAPERFAYEGDRYLKAYSEESTKGLVDGIKKAQSYEIPNAAKENGVSDWLQARGFTKGVAVASVQTGTMERGDVRSLWDVVNGVTAYARTIPHTNDRVDLELKAGKLMDLIT